MVGASCQQTSIKSVLLTEGIIMVDYTRLYMTVPDGEANFEVPTDWLEGEIESLGYRSFEEFMGSYDSDDSAEIYERAILAHVI